MRHCRLAAILGLGLILIAGPAAAADRGKVQAFVAVTGYDVVIESLQQGAMAGPGMVGDAPDSFGRDYARLAEEVFEPEAMKERALDILAAVMPDELIDAGAAFYASDLGQRLVAVAGLADHLGPFDVGEEGAQPIEGQRFIVDQQHAHRHPASPAGPDRG